MTKQEVKELTLKVWEYLWAHPEIVSKAGLPKELWEKIEDMNGECPLCEAIRIGSRCKGCPLYEAHESCYEDKSAYDRWFASDTKDSETRKEAAGRIVEIVSAWEPEEASE
jgi:hypothetical protein